MVAPFLQATAMPPARLPNPLKEAAAGAESEESEEESSEEDEDVVELIDTKDRCEASCKELTDAPVIAVDIEGVNLGREGEICVIQIATESRHVYLFDIVTLGAAAFDLGLKVLLESEKTTKLTFDFRSDADALQHCHGVKPANVLDMQVLCHKAKAGNSRHVHGMAKAVGHVLPYAQRQLMKGVKLAGASLFAPNMGGSLECWRKRPLPEVLQKYCAQDVVHLFTMLKRWQHCLPLDTLRSISEQRFRKHVDAEKPESGPGRALQDFEFPDEAARKDDDGENPAKRQRT
eukprot:TRINITY_DN68912_c0_g1_i1.p1 TRINITY_DN68912_c0_g1~~TRINITY_DN68912_c0_g1_i1.p1  ORF type:complete len:301 (-),score=76.85 TRINITY_DN68912_c0_g1_i1:547-1416(-)